MNIYRLTKLIQELEQIENPYAYDIELLKLYKKKKEILIKKINNKLNMKRFLGIEQKKKQRELKKWIDNLSVEDSKRMNVKKGFDLSTGNIVKTFGDYFKPKNK